MTNLETVQSLYAAFGRGDVPAILSRLAQDVRWEYSSVTSDAPWLTPRTGRDGAAEFFEALSAIEITRFEPRDFLAGDRVVVVLLDIEFTVRKTGKRVVEPDEIHVWRFNERGEVSHFRHGADTHAHHLAWHG
ncbi:MAG: nuclear transport factor 2 family protein [Phycisphaerales bacterium]|nr:nuclear transport factor 2 family protein [Phycisphaerales bacterium]MCB9840894.1 nuclear transport factor 2 family protein [Phycisphaeraceae bacterium]